MAMIRVNIGEFKNDLSRLLARVEAGEPLELSKRNVPFARIVPLEERAPNRTILGKGRGSVRIVGDLTEPMLPEGDWEMLAEK